MSTVLFLGAGASKDAGYPLASELKEALHKKYKDYSEVQLKESWDKFNTYISRSKNLILRSNNPELILTYPDILLEALTAKERSQLIEIHKQSVNLSEAKQELIKKKCGKSIQNIIRIENIRNDFIKIIGHFFLDKHCTDNRNKDTYQYLINAFKGLKKGDTIITTNWDTLAELALLDLNKWNPTDGSHFIKKLKMFEPRPFRKRRKPHNQVSSDPLFSPSKIKVLKLHGSVGWHSDDDEYIILRYFDFLQHFPLSNKATYTDANYPDDIQPLLFSSVSTHTDGTFPEKYRIIKPMLILPSYIKQITSQILQNIWIEADLQLKKASNIFFVGYSLPQADIGIRTLLNPLRKRFHEGKVKIICVLGPDENKTIENRWKTFLGRDIVIDNKTAKEYFTAKKINS